MIKSIYEKIGQQIQRLRQRRGLTQTDLAHRLNLSRTTIVNIEQGRQAVMLPTLYTLTEILNVPLSDLLPNQPVKKAAKTATHLPASFNNELTPQDRDWIKNRLAQFSNA